MKAVCWYGVGDVRVEEVPDPKVLNPRDAVVRVTRTAICGSDLHLYGGFIPAMKKGDILGHEFMGDVVEVGRECRLREGDRVVVAFPIACGGCYFCKTQQQSLCDNSNTSAEMARKLWGHTTAGIFGYSHLVGGYAGGQSQMVRVPYADTTTIVVPREIPDEKVLFLSDIFPTGWQAAEQCGIKPGDTIAVWGCGPVGQMAIRSCVLQGAERVIAIDDVPERLEMAAAGGAEIMDLSEGSIYERLLDVTGGRGPDACIDAVGMEAHGFTFDAWYDRVKTAAFSSAVRAHALREAIWSVRKGGTVSVPGVYGGPGDKVPLGAAFQKGVTFRGGQTHVQKHMPMLLKMVAEGRIDPSFVITHRLGIDDAPWAYETFQKKRDRCIKVVMDPWAAPGRGAGSDGGEGREGRGADRADRSAGGRDAEGDGRRGGSEESSH